MPSSKTRSPHWYRIYLVLHYLESQKVKDKRYRSETCRLSHIAGHIGGNWLATEKLIEYMIEKQLVVENKKEETYDITTRGEELLPALGRADEIMFRVPMGQLKEGNRAS